jgi:oligopeptide transport system substrate-binding protein
MPYRLFLGVLLLVAGCDSSRRDSLDSAPPGRPGARGLELHRGNGPEPATLDPHRATGTPEYTILRDMYEGLFGEGPDARLVPGVAERFEISPDSLRYTFELRKDARWSDCTEVTAGDFVDALRRAVDPATASPNAYLLEPVRSAAAIIAGAAPADTLAVSAIGSHRLVIELTEPAGHFPAVLAHAVSYPYRGADGPSNGPYRLAERRLQEYVLLERNSCYWGREEVGIDYVYFHAVQDITTELNMYRAGQLDMTSEIPNTAFEWIQRELPDQLHVSPYLSTYGYTFTIDRPPFVGRPDLRQAVSMAIDREALVVHVTGVGERAAWGWVPPGTAGHDGQAYEWAEWSAEERIAEARRLFAGAAAENSAAARIKVRYDAGQNHERMALALASMWRDTLGIEVELIPQEWKVYLSERGNREPGGLTRLGWSGDYNDPQSFLDIFASDHPQNVTGFADSEYDALIRAAAREGDSVQRRSLFAQAERRLLDAYVVMPLYFNVSKHLVRPYILGFTPNIANHIQTRYLQLRMPDTQSSTDIE